MVGPSVDAQQEARRGAVTGLSIFASTADMEPFIVKVLTGTLPEIAQQALEWGFDGIELLPNPEAVPPADEVEHAVRAAGARVTVINSGRMYAQGMGLLHRDSHSRRRALDAFKRLLDLSAGLGVPIGLGAARGQAELGVAPEDEERVSLGVFEEIAVYAEQVGGVVMIEPADSGSHPGVPTVSDAASWAERIGSPALCTMLDTYQIIEREESFEAAFAAARETARHIHLYDPGRRPPGTGETGQGLDWPAVLDALLASGFVGTGSVVLPDEGDVARAARASAQFLRDLLRAT